jgi:hypothetical protein
VHAARMLDLLHFDVQAGGAGFQLPVNALSLVGGGG